VHAAGATQRVAPRERLRHPRQPWHRETSADGVAPQQPAAT
jgi:hypothetical protein